MDQWSQPIARRKVSNLIRVLANRYNLSGKCQVRVLRENDRNLTACLAFSEKKFVAKFKKTDDLRATERFLNEIDLYRRLNDSNLAPKLLAYSEAEKYILLSVASGVPLSSETSVKSVHRHLERLGRWFADFVFIIGQKHEKSATWGDYLSTYEGFWSNKVLSVQKYTIDLPIGGWTIARNDSHLSNFIVGEDGEICAVDYEMAVLKPVGWDLLLVSRALRRRFPINYRNMVSTVVNSSIISKDPEYIEAFISLCCFFAEQDITPKENENYHSISNMSSSFFLSNWGEKDEVAFTVPTVDDDTLESNEYKARNFENYFIQEVKKAKKDHSTSIISEPFKLGDSPLRGHVQQNDQHLSSYCGFCRGKCCKSGLINHGFLNAKSLQEIFTFSGLESIDDLADVIRSHIPPHSFKGGCVFQTSGGCNLPREIRSNTCNEFFCGSALRFKVMLKGHEDRYRFVTARLASGKVIPPKINGVQK